jgi:hypothetical protein
MFQMHRIFCATPWELEAERDRFHDLIGNFNEAAAMQKGVLFVPVTLVNIRDKRPMQYAVDENIRDCRHYILLLTEDWGPVERNFRNDYHLALQCIADPALPMHSVAVLAKKQLAGVPLAEGLSEPHLPEPHAIFSTLTEFDDCVNKLLPAWLESIAPNSITPSITPKSITPTGAATA